ncbi:hypothetical protein [Oceanobacillus sp. CF4.6]|uniref:hypothetical protein n=1 Tax=Oceanobacillus sp. CF4.6 TaxID=3373080 RepID=UPI003EE57945
MNKDISIFIVILLVGLVLFIAGCSPNTETEPLDENIATIETIMEHSFTGPEQELIEIWNNIHTDEDEMEDIESAFEALNSYTSEKFKPYFTEEGYSSYISSFGFTFLNNAYRNDYQLNLNRIEVETSEVNDNIYKFSLEVHYQKEYSDEHELVVNATGEVNINEDGLISNMLIRGNELMEALE